MQRLLKICQYFTADISCIELTIIFFIVFWNQRILIFSQYPDTMQSRMHVCKDVGGDR